jgi:hypothetical protein
MATTAVSSADVKFISDEQLEQSLPAVFAERLKAIAVRQGISMENALAQAILLDEMVLDTQRGNGEVHLLKGGKKFVVNFR